MKAKAQCPSKQCSKVYKQPCDSYQALNDAALALALNMIKSCSGHPQSYVGQFHTKWHCACCAIPRRMKLTLEACFYLSYEKYFQGESMIKATPTSNSQENTQELLFYGVSKRKE